MEYLEKISTLFRSNHDPEIATPMAAYLKNKFQCLGLKRPKRNELQKQFFKDNGLPEVKDLAELTRQLWKLPERELHYFTMDLLVRMQRKLPEDFIGSCKF